MSTQKKTSDTFSFRMEAKEREKLQKEAEAEKRTLASYMRWLIDTHPHREKFESKKK